MTDALRLALHFFHFQFTIYLTSSEPALSYCRFFTFGICFLAAVGLTPNNGFSHQLIFLLSGDIGLTERTAKHKAFAL
jgi:hypothetical protein